MVTNTEEDGTIRARQIRANAHLPRFGLGAQSMAPGIARSIIHDHDHSHDALEMTHGGDPGSSPRLVEIILVLPGEARWQRGVVRTLLSIFRICICISPSFAPQCNRAAMRCTSGPVACFRLPASVGDRATGYCFWGVWMCGGSWWWCLPCTTPKYPSIHSSIQAVQGPGSQSENQRPPGKD